MLFDNLYAADVSGIMTNNNTGFAASGLNNYLYLKFAWGTPDPEKLFREALRDCYGAHGAPVMKAYTADLEKRMAAFALERPDEDIALGYIKRYPAIYAKVYQGLSETWSRKLDDAIRKTADPGQKARLQIIADNLAYCKITVDFYRTCTSLLASRNPAPAQAASADRLAAQREAILLKQANPPANIFCKLRIMNNLRFFHLLDRKALQYLMTAQTRRHIKAERCTAPPVLDGKLNEKFWEALPSQRIEKNANAETVKVGADVRIAVVNNDLYIGIHCEEPLMEKIADRKRDPESAVWQENCIDLFFAPPNRHNHYYQLIFNSLGTMRTFHYTPESGPWNANAEVRTFRGKNFWSAEVRIPFASIRAFQIAAACSSSYAEISGSRNRFAVFRFARVGAQCSTRYRSNKAPSFFSILLSCLLSWSVTRLVIANQLSSYHIGRFPATPENKKDSHFHFCSADTGR